MSVCRTCLVNLTNTSTKYSLDQTVNENSKQTETDNQSNQLKLKKMIEKCMPEMDLDICDSPVLCENCFSLLIPAYRFRIICVQTEEKIYQFIEQNNLRLGESIDLSELSNESPVIKLENETVALKEEPDVPERSIIENSNNELNPKPKRKRLRKKVQQLLSECSTDDKNNDLARHQVSTKNSKSLKRPFTCNKCQYKASQLELLKKHMKLKCEVKVPSIFKCDKCDYQTIRQRNLKRHELVHGGPRPFVCGVCTKGFTEKSYLKYHMFKHQSDKPLPFQCQEKDCNYASARNCDLSAHLLTHLKSDYLFCKGCKQKAFPTKSVLLKHEERCKMMQRIHKV